ncbi:MAG: hypothetical protein WBE48_11405, partial [Xanthobacteraceae bacterium]
MSIFWTLSGSCPLCLTPPCYHLEPPATAALFCSVCDFSIVAARAWQRWPMAGNYVGSFIPLALDSLRISRDAVVSARLRIS